LTEEDATYDYLTWLKEDSMISRYISGSSSKMTIDSIKGYIKDKNNRNDALFFGIFEKKSLKHIGNIKFEPVNLHKSFVIMGMLIGCEEWRGKGVASEVIKSSGNWLSDKYGIKYMVLVVDHSNIRAIKAYEKSGFCFEDSSFIPNSPEYNNPKMRTMVLQL
jgi:RimJ/RimL family protein N-acetyltransferase